MQKATIKKVFWNEIREKVELVNPMLTQAIDEVDPGKEYVLYKISYPFGQTIIENGVFHLPLSNGEIVPIHDARVSNNLKSDFKYAAGGFPPGVVLQNSYELFIDTQEYILPILIAKPGSIVALWKMFERAPHFHPLKIFSANAGARSIFMLPNISDLALHKNLKADFNVRQPPPKNLLDQWNIFKTIINHPASECHWETEILFFPGRWLEKIKNDKAWSSLFLVLLQGMWDSCVYERNRAFYDFAISTAQANRNLKPNPYLSDTLGHLLMISLGTGVGFGIAINDTLAPIKVLQKAYLDSYGLKRYAPTIMHPVHFSLITNCNPVYYSLSLPTTLAFSPKSRKISNTLHDLAELKHILIIFLEEVRSGRLKIEDTAIGMLATQLNYDFFHNKYDKHLEIRLTTEIVKTDEMLAKELMLFPNKEFSESGTFVRGCIRISHKSK